MQDEGSCSLIVCEGTFPWEWNMAFLSLQRGPVSHSTGGTTELLSKGAGKNLGGYHPGQETASPFSWPCLGQTAQLPQPVGEQPSSQGVWGPPKMCPWQAALSTWQREETVKKCLVTHLSYLLPLLSGEGGLPS